MVRNYSVLVAIAVVLSACSQPQQPQMTPPAGFIVVKEQPVELKSELPGRTDPTAVSMIRDWARSVMGSGAAVAESSRAIGVTRIDA